PGDRRRGLIWELGVRVVTGPNNECFPPPPASPGTPPTSRGRVGRNLFTYAVDIDSMHIGYVAQVRDSRAALPGPAPRIRDQAPVRGAPGWNLGGEHWAGLHHLPAPGARPPDPAARRPWRPRQALLRDHERGEASLRSVAGPAGGTPAAAAGRHLREAASRGPAGQRPPG